MDKLVLEEEYITFLNYYKEQVDPNDPLPLRVPVYSFTEDEISAEIIHWVHQYLTQMNCPQYLLVPLVNEVLQEIRNSCKKLPKCYGFDGYAFNPLKLSTMVISHVNSICEGLLDNEKLNAILTKNHADVLERAPQHYVKAIKNTRRKMEDRHTCIRDFNGMFEKDDPEPTSYYAVFDGHGGHDAAIYAAAHLGYNIAKSSHYPNNILGAIREAFKKTDNCFIDKCEKHVLSSGTTAIACVYRAIEKRLFVGWVGDSQALLACEGKVCQIVSPHNPSVESEQARIEKNGGVVIHWGGSYRVNGVLAVSRAIGDASYKPYVSSDPDTSCISLNGKEDFLIIASDGLWESLSEDNIALFVYRQIMVDQGCVDSIADALIEQAKKGTPDNITVIIVFFKDPKLIAKSSWLIEMEAACDNHSSNNPFGNEIKSPSMTITEGYNESCDKKVVNNNPITSELENNNQFDDDLGPETDVDGQDDANSNDSTNKLQTEDILDNNIPNSAKSDPLENKIIQHLSEQNAHFLDINNPFKDETIDEYQEKILLESINDGSDRMSEQVVDNKIIDALESLGFTKEEKVCCQSENVALDLMGDPVDSSNLAEKVDYIHEKQCTGLEAETVEPPNDHSTSIFEMDTDVNGAQDDTDFIHLPTAIGDPCTAEESDDEEEEEWNYIKGDKKLLGQSDAATAEKSDNTNETFEQLTNEVEKTTETVIVQSTLPGDDLLLDTCTSMDVEDNLWMDNEFQTKATAIQQVHLEHTEESPTQESSHPCDVEPVIDPKTSTILDCDEQQNTADNQSSPFDCVTTDQLEKELVSVEESSVDAKEEDHQIVDTNTKTGFEGNIERPDNLSLEMASKLNPEAKEFVPVCSPTRSDPASPVTSIPPVLQNPYLILPNDMVIAQSPKKDITTMDNIDVPAEDDFQHEMNNRPHEFENTAGYTNGNLETFQSHSPVSEPSYQEINLKEAMQCDEKLDGEYSDEKQAALTGEIIPEVPIEKSLLTAFSKEPDAMNTSFYEGRDEPMLTSSSDELNKVHLLPDEDVSEQCSVDETKNLCLLENEANLNAQALSNVENEARESETVSTPDVENGNESSVNIFAVASQVVSDVTALVDQMQIDSQSPTSEIPTILDSLTENPDNLTENNEIVNDSVTLLNLNDQSEQKNINVLDIDNVDKSDHSETIEENIVLPTVETKEMATPEVLVMEEKVNIENENIQTSVLHVETPIVEDNESPATLRSLPNEGSEQFVQDNRETEIVKTPFDETVDLKSADVSVVLSDNKISSAVVLDTPKTEEASNQNAGAEETLIESDVPVKTIAASSMSKTVTAKSTSKVSAAPSIEKKTTPISSKLNTKSTKLTTATKPTTATSTVRKSAVSSVATSATSVKPSATASKPSTASAATRTNVASKTISEKKPLLGLTKKPPASLTTNSDEPKPTVTARKVPTTTTSKPVPTKSTTSSSVNNRPSSTVPKTAVPLKAVASTTRPTSSPPAKTRTVASSVASVKPRVLPIKTTVKAVSSLSTTTTTATTTASRTSVPGSTTRKLNNVPGTGQKTTATSKPSTLESKTNCTTSRVSATAKTSTTTVGSQRKLSAPQNKKLIPSPALKTTGSKSSTATKPAPISKKAVNNCSEMNASENDAKSLLDYDKQLKNDCNQLITKNGIETQMIVIDSAAD